MDDPALLAMLRPVLAVWMFALGASIGSFLNVVVYRLPRGLSLIHPGSHCPNCKHPIRPRDNLPIFGWLLLGGRCRDCGEPIAARYPTVEALTAGVFLLVALVEVLSLGTNLPRRPIVVTDGLIYPGLKLAESFGIGLFHLVLLSTLLPASLMEYDGQHVPWRLAMPALLVGLLAPLAWPMLHPVPAWTPMEGWLGGLADGLAGLAAGSLLGFIAWTAAGRKWNSLVLAPACVGLYLGWQAIAALTPVVLLAFGLTWLAGRKWQPIQRIGPCAWWFVLTLIWLLAWKPLVELLPLR